MAIRSDADPAPVLLLVPSLIRAGAETQAISLANGLAGEGFDVHLASFGESLDQLDRVDRERVVFHRLERRGRLGLSFVGELARLLRTHRYGVIHCTLQISLFYAWLARLLSGHRAALVVAIHTTQNLSGREERFDRWVYRPLIARCARTVFVCRAQADYWVRRFPELEATATVIYNGIDAQHFLPAPEHVEAATRLRESLDVGEDDTLLVCVARLRPEKGHLLLLDALAAIQASPRIHLALAGDGVMRAQIEQRRDALELTERVHLLGDVQETRSLYAAADASVLASTSVETFSMAMLESLAMCTPMIATAMGGMGEAIENGETGWLIPAGDVPALAQAIGAVATDRTATAALGVRGRARVLASFTVVEMVRQTAALLRTVAPTTGGTETSG